MDYEELDPNAIALQEYDMYEPTTAEIWATCGWSSLHQILTYYCLPFVFWNIAFRITTQTCNFEMFSFVLWELKKNANNFDYRCSDSFRPHSTHSAAHIIHRMWFGTVKFHTRDGYIVHFGLHMDPVRCIAGHFSIQAAEIWSDFDHILPSRSHCWVSLRSTLTIRF